MSKLMLFFLNSRAWLWLLWGQGRGWAHSVVAAGQQELVKGSAGLAVPWRRVSKGGANTSCQCCTWNKVQAVLDGWRGAAWVSGGVFSPRLYRIGIPISEGFHACLEQRWNCCCGIPAWLTDRQGMQEEEEVFSGIHLASAEHQGLLWFALNGPQNITKKQCQCCKNQVQTQINISFTDRAEAQISSLINSSPSWAAKETFSLLKIALM